jgi:hypothetical protein
MAKIVTSYEYPPIPVRHFDWCAHYDDPEGPTGWGRTEQEAIGDLLSKRPPCKNKSPYVRADGGCLRCDADQGEACRDAKSQPTQSGKEE